MSAETGLLVQGEKAELVADSAMEEALAQLRLQINEEGGPLFKAIRALLYHPGQGASSTGANGSSFPRRASSSPKRGFRGYALESLSVRVVLQKQIDGTPYERNGLLRLEACVRGPGGRARGVLRRVEAVQSFRSVLCSVPQPFSSYGFFLADVGLLTDLPAINRQRDELLVATQRLWEWIREARGPAPTSMGRLYTVLEDGIVSPDAARNAKPIVESEVAAFYGLPIAGVKMDLAPSRPLGGSAEDPRRSPDEARGP